MNYANEQIMTLDEAIKHCYEVADRKCDDCGKEHLQLAKWLEELRDFKNKTDFMEVVRCVQCNFRGTEDCPRAYWLELAGDYVDPTEDDDFCSYGIKQ